MSSEIADFAVKWFNRMSSGTLDTFVLVNLLCIGSLIGLLTCITQSLVAFFGCDSAKGKTARRKTKAAERIERVRQKLRSWKNIDHNITRLSFKELQSKLQKGELRARNVLTAFQHRALQVHDEINCVTEFVESAEKIAQDLDNVGPEKRGPLHGIPISIKETVGLAGYDCTAGYTCFIDQNFQEDGVMMKVLKEQGAIPFAITNLGQGQMSIRSSNPIYGVTVHPLDHDRTCGGSSGGEAALISARGSILGIGCDAGGSNRIPAHFCGVCGLKQTSNRTSNKGNYIVGAGMSIGIDIFGPLGRDVDSLVETLKATLCPTTWELDPYCAQAPWREELYSSKKPMTIGYYIHDGGLEPTPAVKRCVLEAKDVLEKMGHRLVEFEPPGAVKAVEELFLPALMGDNGQRMLRCLKSSLADTSMLLFKHVLTMPIRLRLFVAKLMFFLHPLERAVLGFHPPRDVKEWWDHVAKVDQYCEEFIEAWKSQDLDAVICPVMPFPAFQKNDDFSCLAGCTYTSLYSLLDFPAGAYPFGEVEQKDVDAMEDYPNKLSAEKFVHEVCKDSKGLPIGIQCVALPYQEEITLRVMKQLEEGQKSSKPTNDTPKVKKDQPRKRSGAKRHNS